MTGWTDGWMMNRARQYLIETRVVVRTASHRAVVIPLDCAKNILPQTVSHRISFGSGHECSNSCFVNAILEA